MGTTGTFAQPTAGSSGRGLSGATASAAFQFTAPATSTVTQIKVNCFAVTTGATFEARLYTDNAGSPGTQIGSAWGSQVISTTGDKLFSGGLAGITNGTLYWIVLANTATTPNLSLDTCTDQAGYGSGRGNTITGITNNLPSLEDWRMEITYGVFSLTAVAGAYVLSGKAALKKLSANFTAGAYVLTGKAANLVKGRVLAAAAGSYILTGVTVVAAALAAAASKFKLRLTQPSLKSGQRSSAPTLQD